MENYMMIVKYVIKVFWVFENDILVIVWDGFMSWMNRWEKFINLNS